MPNGDGTGPDGKGPKRLNKGWPERYARNQGAGGQGRRMRRRDGSCQRQVQPKTDPSDE